MADDLASRVRAAGRVRVTKRVKVRANERSNLVKVPGNSAVEERVKAGVHNPANKETAINKVNSPVSDKAEEVHAISRDPANVGPGKWRAGHAKECGDPADALEASKTGVVRATSVVCPARAESARWTHRHAERWNKP